MDQRVQFIADWLSGDYSKSALSAAYDISRPTVNKWIKRYEAHGAEGLYEQSRAPHSQPNRTPERVRQRLIEVKLAHQQWGPKKVVDWLRLREPDQPWPADSTVGEILKQAGLVRPRKRRRRIAPYTEPFGACDRPNRSWSADFKGDFALATGRRCYPLTLSDNYSRYLLACRALERTSYQAVRPWFEWVFREVGLPEAIRTDNGSPFSSLALGGLSALSTWLIRLGIRPERIRPGKPSENGRHERMHRTLKAEAVEPRQASLSAQQQQFDVFVEAYNIERSHEALGRQTPASVYQPSPRAYPARLPPVEYPEGVSVRKVRHNGQIKWQGRLLYLAEVLAKEPVGLRQVDNGVWELRYSFHLLGYFDEQESRIVPARGWHGRKV